MWVKWKLDVATDVSLDVNLGEELVADKILNCLQLRYSHDSTKAIRSRWFMGS